MKQKTAPIERVENRLRELLAELNMKQAAQQEPLWNQSDVARRLNLSPEVVSRYFNNDVTRYDWRLVASFCNFFGIEWGDFWRINPERPRQPGSGRASKQATTKGISVVAAIS